MFRSKYSAFTPYRPAVPSQQGYHLQLPVQPLTQVPAEIFEMRPAKLSSLIGRHALFEDEQEEEEEQYIQEEVPQQAPIEELPEMELERQSSVSSDDNYSYGKSSKNECTLSDEESNVNQSTQSVSPFLSERPLLRQDAADDERRKGFDISTYKLEFTDLNECVAALLKKTKDESASGRDVKRRQRKNKEQLRILENEFLKNPDWSRSFIKSISQRLGLRECQAYKWHWDQRKKEGLAVGIYPLE